VTTPRTLAADVAAFGLSPLHAPLLDAPLDESAWGAFLAFVKEHRLVGLLAAAVEDGSFALSDAQRAELTGVVDEAAAVRRDLETSLLELSHALSGAGITHRVLRGCAAAYLDYPQPVQRTFRRVELLVPVPAFDEAAALFSAMGCVRRFAEPRPGFDRRFSMGTSFFTPHGHELVLRRTFVSGPYGMLVTPADLFSRSTPLSVGGHELVALGTEERFLHACFYARLGRDQSELVLLRDVAQMVLTHALDIDSIERLSTAWKAESVVAEAVDLAWSTLKVVDIVHLSAWAAAHRPERADRRRLRVYDHTYDYARNGAALSFSAVREIRPRRATLRFLRAVVLPDRAYLEGRYRGHLQRWWRGTCALSAHVVHRDGRSRQARGDVVVAGRATPARDGAHEQATGSVAAQHA